MAWHGEGGGTGAREGVHSGGTSATFHRRWRGRRFAPAPTSDPPGIRCSSARQPGRAVHRSSFARPPFAVILGLPAQCSRSCCGRLLGFSGRDHGLFILWCRTWAGWAGSGYGGRSGRAGGRSVGGGAVTGAWPGQSRLPPPTVPPDQCQFEGRWKSTGPAPPPSGPPCPLPAGLAPFPQCRCAVLCYAPFPCPSTILPPVPVPAPTTPQWPPRPASPSQPRIQNPLPPATRQHRQPPARIITKYRHPNAVAAVAPATEFCPARHKARPSR